MTQSEEAKPNQRIHIMYISEWPRTRENRENDEKKFPVWKNQGIWEK